MNKRQEELVRWAKETSELYNSVGKEHDIAYYTQSPLDKLGDGPVDVMIIGINPGSDGSYYDMLKSSGWTHSTSPFESMPYNHLLKGNHFKNRMLNCTSWDMHLSWGYFKGLMRYFSQIGDSNILLDESRFVLTNVTFFNTSKVSSLLREENKGDIRKRTIESTLKLIKIVQPKMILFLSGEAAFGLLKEFKDDFLFEDFGSGRKIQKVIGSSFQIGSLAGVPCFGVRHPGHAREEEVRHVSEFISCVYGKAIEEIRGMIPEINRRCQDAVKYIIRAKQLSNHPVWKSHSGDFRVRIDGYVSLVFEIDICFDAHFAKQGNVAVRLDPDIQAEEYALSVAFVHPSGQTVSDSERTFLASLSKLLYQYRCERQPEWLSREKYTMTKIPYQSDNEKVIKLLLQELAKIIEIKPK